MDRLMSLKFKAGHSSQGIVDTTSQTTTTSSRRFPFIKSSSRSHTISRRRSTSSAHTSPKRHIYVNTELPSEELDELGQPKHTYSRNKIRTSKYTLATFLPKNLFEQFRGVANLYFLFLAVLQLFPVFAGPNAFLAPLPLLAILTITAIKDAFEDWKRHKSDNAVNNSRTRTLANWHNVNARFQGGKLQRRVWAFVKWCSLWLILYPLWAKKRRADGDELPMDEDYVNVERTSQGGFRLETLRYPQVLGGSKRHPYRPGLLPHSVLKTRPPPQFDEKHPPPQIKGRAEWQDTLWKNVRVGDFVRLESEDPVPADMIILSTSEPGGVCYVETKNLDGETNLKPRHSLRATSDITKAADCQRASFTVESEGPHPNLYSYSGVMEWKVSGGADMGGVLHSKTEPITISHMLLRGSVLKNTEWVIGLVVFTGSDTKVMLNSSNTPSKRSRVEKQTNPHVVANFVILFALCLGCSVVNGILFDRGSSSWYFEPGGDASNGGMSGFLTFWLCLILYQSIVPISLYVSVEIVKTLSAYFIHADVDMYYEPLDQPCIPKTWNISDDLGQIEYIFSDKTGTLTQNVMEFRKCTIDGIKYGCGQTEAMRGAKKREALQGYPAKSGGVPNKLSLDEDENLEAAKKQMLEEMAAVFDNKYLSEKINFVAPGLFKHLAQEGSHRDAIRGFFSALSLCHTVLCNYPEEENKHHIVYKAQSPDEAALVQTAKDCGFAFLSKDQERVVVDVLGEKREYNLLHVLEFNSTRKRMSVILEVPEEGEWSRAGARGGKLLICKGADSVIYERLWRLPGEAKDEGDTVDQEVSEPEVQGDSRGPMEDALAQHQARVRQTTLQHLEEYADEGLRTLCIAYRYIPDDEYARWEERFRVASSSLVNREEQIEAVSEEIEQDLLLMGGTAIEDRLQEGVPETIEHLSQAGIKIWVLTGDKMETAINIGFACNLLRKDMRLVVISGYKSLEAVRQKLIDTLSEIWGVEVNEDGEGDDANSSEKRRFSAGTTTVHRPEKDAELQHALIIDGETLKCSLERSARDLLLEVARRCDSVICCRVSPLQKAKMVNLVKKGLHAMTLAIGDGANDVSMIQEANVGVGMCGEEGRQAVMASDYAIGQFRFLAKLLLVHGRWSYIRTSSMILVFFYKNVVWTFALFWYQFYSAFSGDMFIEYSLVMLYNLIFTSLPCIFLGVFDQDLSAYISLAVPQLYKRGIQQLYFTTWQFWLHILDAFYQSIVVFYIPFLLLTRGPNVASGHDTNGMYDFGTVVGACVTVVANLYVFTFMYNFTVMMTGVILASIFSFFLWVEIYSWFDTIYMYREDAVVFGQFNFWLVLLIVVVAALLPRVVVKYVMHMSQPTDADIIREEVMIARQERKRRGSNSSDWRIEAVLMNHRRTRNESIPSDAPSTITSSGSKTFS
ncbi:uncharacterized protein VTP21DRAFT_7568 [Calcarisporiella thermophila]|uniref:uncharacterized protein n=1 Tax=Calcarisporiella thermophila TaxID=911321 RepID=UPI003741F58E